MVDRAVVGPDQQSRIGDSIEQALSLSAGVLEVAIATADRDEPLWEEKRHSQHLVCGSCERSFQPLTPHHFSFNSAVGWCPQCEGLGTQRGTNPAALLTSLAATLNQGASLLWPGVDQAVSRAMLRALARVTGLPLDLPIDEMTASERRILFHGTGAQWIEVRASDLDSENGQTAAASFGGDHRSFLFRYQFKGFYPALEEAARLTPSLRGKLEAFVDEIACTTCDGARLRDDAAAVRFRELTIGDLVQVPLGRLQRIVDGWKLDTRERKIAGELVREVDSRIRFLVDVGLEYLTLSRGAATLSGGESQRIRLAAQLGSGLCGVLYVLDEPTIGLHPRDNHRLIAAMHRLRDLGNTLLVVEHDRDVIASSDYLCDFGPLAGKGGGRVVAAGTPNNITPLHQSVTAGFIDGRQQIPLPESRREVVMESPDSPAASGRASRSAGSGALTTPCLTVRGAKENNLRGIDVRFPLGVLCAVTGPSGSGKSSLVNGILYPVLARRLHRARVRPGRHDTVDGIRYIDKVIRVDQSPLGNTPSSNPATYTGAFELIRQLFARLPESEERKLTARHFSFNVPAGRCEGCEGTGRRRIEMHFLPDVWVECEDCHGKRYQEEVLQVKLHGKSISDLLDMPIGDAVSLFADHPRIVHILQTICDVGLDYITLGQSAPTLSGGEAQRIKLAAELARPDTGRTLYLLDEPTTGLHFNDIIKLMNVLQRLVDLGNSVIVIEHNLDVIKLADWVIDIGPDAGSRGGQVVAEGPPEAVAAAALAAKQLREKLLAGAESPLPRSFTGEYLAPLLDQALIEAHLAGRAASVPSLPPVEVADDQSAAANRRRPPIKRRKASPQLPPAYVQQLNGTAQPHPGFAATAHRIPETESTGLETLQQQVQPWKLLGRRWHSLSKGFPNNNQPQWPLELAEKALAMLEGIAGESCLSFEAPDRVAVRGAALGETWAEVETKTPDSLRVTLAGPAEAIDLDLLERLGIDGPVDVSDVANTRVTLKLTDLKHVRSRNLKAFIKNHWHRSSQTQL